MQFKTEKPIHMGDYWIDSKGRLHPSSDVVRRRKTNTPDKLWWLAYNILQLYEYA